MLKTFAYTVHIQKINTHTKTFCKLLSVAKNNAQKDNLLFFCLLVLWFISELTFLPQYPEDSSVTILCYIVLRTHYA